MNLQIIAVGSHVGFCNSSNVSSLKVTDFGGGIHNKHFSRKSAVFFGHLETASNKEIWRFSLHWKTKRKRNAASSVVLFSFFTPITSRAQRNSKSSTKSLQLVQFSEDSHVLNRCEKFSHLTRYSFWIKRYNRIRLFEIQNGAFWIFNYFSFTDSFLNDSFNCILFHFGIWFNHLHGFVKIENIIKWIKIKF